MSGVVQAIPLRPERERSGSGFSPFGCCRALGIKPERRGHPPSVLTIVREIIHLRLSLVILFPERSLSRAPFFVAEFLRHLPLGSGMRLRLSRRKSVPVALKRDDFDIADEFVAGDVARAEGVEQVF